MRWIQCEDCAREFTEQTWKALVQIRQRVESKRTLFLVEQLILARRLQRKVLDVELAKDGMDIYFADKVRYPPASPPDVDRLQHRRLVDQPLRTLQNTAVSFVSFLGTIAPLRTRTSRKLVSEDRKNNIHRNQHTLVVEIAPLCKVGGSDRSLGHCQTAPWTGKT